MTDREKLETALLKSLRWELDENWNPCRLDYEATSKNLIANGVVVREKGEWKPRFIYTGRRFDSCTQGVEGWECSNCGYTTLEKFDFCTCGADMRKGENG